MALCINLLSFGLLRLQISNQCEVRKTKILAKSKTVMNTLKNSDIEEMCANFRSCVNFSGIGEKRVRTYLRGGLC